MADDAPRRLHAAPRTLPPGNTLGYDLDDPTMRAAVAAARSDPALLEEFADRLRKEQARFSEWDREVSSLDGVRPVGSGPGPFIPCDPAILLDEAKDRLRRKIGWRQSPGGRLHAGIVEAEKAASALCAALIDLDDARCRDPRKCAAYARKVEDAAVKAFGVAAVLPGLADRAAAEPAPQAPHVADLHATIHDIVMGQG